MDMRQLVGRNFARSRILSLSDSERTAGQRRAASGLTQEQLAERCGVSRQYISGLEKGKRNPTIVTLYVIAQGLGVSHVELVRED
jgi:transcriptional regulator with XRE-family HTH domain